jgi:hypothetical protein
VPIKPSLDSLTPPGLAGQLITLIYEEAYLAEVGEQVTEYLGDDRTVVHGPWDVVTCSRLLRRWFEAGWLELYAFASVDTDAPWRARTTVSGSNGEFRTLDRSDTAALLADPATWSQDADGAGVMLCRTDATDGKVLDDWIALVADIEGTSER